MNEKFFHYRGDLSAVATVGKSSIAFVTVHPDGIATAIHRLDCEKLDLAEEPLPCGGRAIIADGDTLWIAGTDGKVYESTTKRKTPKALKAEFDPPPIALALLSNDRLAVLSGETVGIVDRKKGELLQSLALPEAGSALTADPTGQWLAVGTQKGTVVIFECEEKDEFLQSESGKLHDGAVTAMLFEPDELRFLSAGTDQKLLITHARGTLEPEDRGRGAMHEDIVTAIVHVPGERFITGGRDSVCKTWSRGDRTRPATLSDGVVKVADLAVVEIHSRPHLIIAGQDNTLRFFLLDAGGKFGPATHKLHAALASAKHELEQTDTARREKALKQLADWNDAASLAAIAERITTEQDAGLRRLATNLIADSGHAHAAKHLEGCLDHGDEVVRLTAFEGLQKIHGKQDFRPLDLALKSKHENVAAAAIAALATFAAKDDRAHARLVSSLEHKNRNVAQAALLALEDVHGKTAEGDLLGLASKKHAHIRRLALIRLLQRKLLGETRVLSAIRRQLESNEADVRHTAFHVLVLSRPNLAAALRERDADLHRHLFELESFTLEPKKTDKPPTLPKAPKAKGKLQPDDLEPLLQATASRALDTCVLGTRCLALLQDARSLGLLLQLSREEDNAARVAVCRGLADLSDPRGVPRLRSLLFDKAEDVRDAAFSALAAIHKDDPLQAAEAGLAAGKEDVHRRGLELLVRTVRKKSPKKAADAGWDLLLTALNDRYSGVRSEALKACLNLEVAGGKANTLRFVLHSSHADLRRDVLTEVIGQVKQPWAWELLQELFDDPDATIRTEAFEFAMKETKRRDLKPMEAGLKSRFADVRRLAIDELRKQRKAAAQDLIVTAVNDDDLETRQHALAAIVTANARDVLRQTLDSRHVDVRLKAAQALAKHGDDATYEPLLALIKEEKPPADDPRLAAWKKVVAEALDGLSDLGNPKAIEHILPFLDSEFPEIRKEAASALYWSAREEHADLLREKLRHEDSQVKYQAALGLAIQGQADAGPLIRSKEFLEAEDRAMRFLAAVCLGESGESLLVRQLDDDRAEMRWLAVLVLIARELKNHDGTPRRLLLCLSSLMPRIRLMAAEGLRRFTDAESFHEFVVERFNEKENEEPWKIPAETIDTFAQLTCFAEPWIRARILCVLPHFFEEKQDTFDEAWQRDSARFADEIKRLEAEAKKRKLPKIAVDAAELDQLAFGTYIGLVREQGSAHAKKQKSQLGPQVVRVRQTAIARLVEMAEANDDFRSAAIPVLVQALSDPNRDVRNDAFNALGKLGFDSAQLASEAIETGFDDLGIAGLKLLTEGATAAQGRKVLEEVMLSRTDDLAIRAAELLRETDSIRTAAAALESVHQRLRRLSVGWLAADYDDAKARKALQGALQSRFVEVRESAAIELARKKDDKVFDALVAMLNESTDAGRQTKLIEAIVELGDPRGPDALLDRLENDPTGTAREKELLQGAGRFRLPAIAPRLLKCMDKKEWRSICFYAIRRLAGHDQSILDPEDEKADQSWLEKQHPRHDDVLAKLVERLVEFGESKLLAEILPSARWAKSDAVDPVLITVAALPDDDLRNQTIAAVGWRLKKRNGPADALLKALEHKNATTKFLAAEGLALAGRSEGISVLLAAVELLDDLTMRRRAVEALGKLADERALDLLLRLAGEDDHALQENAAEAIGHLGKSDKAEEIFKLLERFAKQDDDLAAFAVRGLRWFNSNDGWKLVRDRALKGSFPLQIEALKALGYNDDEASREILLKAVAGQEPFDEMWDFPTDAMDSARRLFGPDSLEPDYALLKREFFYEHYEPSQRALKRVAEHGEADRLLEITATCSENARAVINTALLQRPELPVDAATAALDGPHAEQVMTAAQILGRAGKVSAAAKKSLESAILKWRDKWQEYRERANNEYLQYDEDHHTNSCCLLKLIWAAGRVDAAKSTLVEFTGDRINDAAFRPIRRAAVAALGETKATKDIREALTILIDDADPEIRQRAASILAADDAKQAAELAGRLVSDRKSFNRLAATPGAKTDAVINDSVPSVHYQGVVLPFAIAGGDEKTLAAAALNADLPEAARYGAVEGLGRIGSSKAEKQLATVGASKEIDEELRKAAWRALRRSKRLREKAKANA